MASIVVAGDTSGTVTLAAPAVSGTTTLTLPTTSGTIVTTSGSQTIEFADGSASAPSITNSGDTNTGMFFPAADTIAFAEGGAESMRIDSSGNVGIGTASPTQKLDVNGNIKVSSNQRVMFGPSGFEAGIKYNTTGELQIAPRSGEAVTFTNGQDGTERMRINSSGALLINRTTQLNSERFAITGNSSSQCMALISPTSAGYDMCNINNSNGQVGLISTSGSSTAYQTSSDYRLKDNVKPMVNALDKVSLLKPVTYKWKVDGTDGQGFIAHELAEVVPDCVSGEKDAVNEDGSIKPQGVDTSFLVATLTAAIQEQQTIIETLKADIAELKAKVK
jgi:hypothetical protein